MVSSEDMTPFIRKIMEVGQSDGDAVKRITSHIVNRSGYHVPDGMPMYLGEYQMQESQMDMERSRRFKQPQKKVPVSDLHPAQEEEARPKCKRHKRFMKYNAAEDRMECEVDGCEMKARKRRTFMDALGAVSGTDPVVYRGALRFVVDADENLYLFLPEANAVISLEALTDEGVGEPFANSYAANVRQATVLKAIGDLLPTANAAAEQLRKRQQQDEQVAGITERFDKRRFVDTGLKHWEVLYGVKIPPHMPMKKVQDLLWTNYSPNEYVPQQAVRNVITEFQKMIDTAKGYGQSPNSYSFYGTKGEPSGYFVTGSVDSATRYARLSDELIKRDSVYPSRAPHYCMVSGNALDKSRIERIFTLMKRRGVNPEDIHF